MKKEQTALESERSKSEILTHLGALVANQASIWNRMIARKPFIGSVSPDDIRLQTYDAPPIQLQIDIDESRPTNRILIHSTLDDSMSKSSRQLTYALGLPIVAALSLWQIVMNPLSIGVYVWSGVAVLVIIMVGKVWIFRFK